VLCASSLDVLVLVLEVDGLVSGNFRAPIIRPVFENTYFSYFSDFKKHDFLRFLKMTLKKRKKSVAKILSSMMLTLLQKRKKVC